MKRKVQPFETCEHDVTGYAAIDFKNGDFNSFACSCFKNYSSNRFEPVTLKLSLETNSFTVTLYARDKAKQPIKAETTNRLPVKKFKQVIAAAEFSKLIYRFAAALSVEKFDIEKMRVINK